MSGIIGGVGARSGVIGTTELDYEEGTWTPTVSATSETVYGAKYIKIGDKVTIAFDFVIGTIGSGSTTTLSGLPFTNPANDMSYPVPLQYFASIAGGTTIALIGQIGNNGTSMTFNGLSSAGTTMTTSHAVFGNSARIIGTGTYFINIA